MIIDITIMFCIGNNSSPFKGYFWAKIWHYFKRNQSKFQTVIPGVTGQGHWQPSWIWHNVSHILKMYPLYQSVTVGSFRTLPMHKQCASPALTPRITNNARNLWPLAGSEQHVYMPPTTAIIYCLCFCLFVCSFVCFNSVQFPFPLKGPYADHILIPQGSTGSSIFFDMKWKPIFFWLQIQNFSFKFFVVLEI